MFKKILITTAILAASANVAFAEAAPYVGAKLGGHSTNGSLKEAGYKLNLNAGRGVDAGVFAGFGGDIDQHFYLGGEVFAEASSSGANKKNSANGAKLTVTPKYSVGASVIPGVKFGQSSMVYGRVGVVRTRFDSKIEQGSLSRTWHGSATGGQLGVGVQTEVAKNVGVRAEFVHTGYRDFKIDNVTHSMKDNQVNFGVFYTFN